PVAMVILTGLFLVQRWGTATVGRFFGPVILIWFLVLGITGVLQVLEQPAILAALNPVRAAQFLWERGPLVLVVVGAIVLAITGAEALYADMGHFGRKPIQLAWTLLVLPSLALQYLGQGALLMRDPGALENPFYRMFPEPLLIPALLLATMAAIIASQAVISGAYSLTKQAILLGYLPRMRIVYTSANEAGQIYMPAVNWLLLGGVLLAVLGFQSSSALAGAYGIAVTLTMVITTTLTFFVVRAAWRLPLWLSVGSTLFFLSIDVFLFLGCVVKLFDGGWFPLALGLVLFVIMSTWARGRALLVESIHRDGMALNEFLQFLSPADLARSTRTAVYAVANPDTVPQALLHNMKHNQVLHEKNIILHVHFDEVPVVRPDERARVEYFGRNFWKVTLHYGFTESPDVPLALQTLQHPELHVDLNEVSYFLSRETVVPTPGAGMMCWREHLFATMVRNAGGVVAFFKLPDNAVVELGTRVQL
ncbi:MAG TPA: KUP/HAK/KT family potassium transporter, partial [Limnobacter sp.]|nr:KUP/HAK/KT family potassium transporter [Limnobacter sp.]